MWRLCLASLLATSASALRGRGVVDTEQPKHPDFWKYPHIDKPHHKDGGHEGWPTKTPACDRASATEKAAETSKATCGPFPGQQVVLVTLSADFMPFFQNWLHYAGPFLTSSEQVVAFAEDEQVVPMLQRFLHTGARTPFKIGLSIKDRHISAAGRVSSQDVYEIRIQDIHPWDSSAYKEIVSQRPRQLMHFLEQGCSVLYADIDTAWVKNPFSAIRSAGNFEMYVTDDSRSEQGLRSHNLCSCFLYMHPTSTVKAVMSRWAFLLEGKLQRNQARFTQAFQETRKCFPHFAVALPRKEFPPGCLTTDTRPTVLHANYLVGEDEKKTFLKTHGAWSLD